MKISVHLILHICVSFLCLTKAGAHAIDTLPREPKYSKQQLVNDVDYITQKIANVHPNSYHAISAKQYNRLKDSVMYLLKDSMTAIEAWPVMGLLVGALNEGHSSLQIPESILPQLKGGANVLFPIPLKEFDGTHFIVTADASAENVLKPGDKIVSINSISAADLVDKLSTYTGGLKAWRATIVCREMISLLHLYGIKGPYHLTYLRGDVKGNVTVKPVSWAAYVTRLTAFRKNNPQAPAAKAYAYTRLDNYTGYLNFTRMREDADVFKRFLDSAFTTIQQQPVSKLVIDLRQNGGGNSALGNQLLSYITHKPYRMTGGVKLRISQEFKDAYKASHKTEEIEQMSGVLNAANGSIITNGGPSPQKPADNNLLYKGPVYVLIGPKTFSSANMLANAIQDYKLATLVGQPTGESANDYGELLFFTLPNTRLMFNTSSKQFIRANGNEKDNNPVLPNIYMRDDPNTTVDEVLNYVKNLPVNN